MSASQGHGFSPLFPSGKPSSHVKKLPYVDAWGVNDPEPTKQPPVEAAKPAEPSEDDDGLEFDPTPLPPEGVQGERPTLAYGESLKAGKGSLR